MKTEKVLVTLETAKQWYEQGDKLKEIALSLFDEGDLVDKPLVKVGDFNCKQQVYKYR